MSVTEAVKRPTRQWAAWTREEEESFFTALRQVGKAIYCRHILIYHCFLFCISISQYSIVPYFVCLLLIFCVQNFEKITCRVQSKNKDQVFAQ